MKKFLILALLLNAALICYGQGCAFSGGGLCDSNLADPTQYAVDVVQNICNVLGTPYIPIYRANIPNACALIGPQGTPIITYNPIFLGKLYEANVWAPISVLAHEVGHHIYQDPSWYGSFQHPWTKELRADYVSGYVMFKLGASLSDAQSAFSDSFSFGSPSHPDTPRRLDAILAGYLRAYQGF
jgi:hypothetical protein